MGHALRIEQELCRREASDGGCLPYLCRVSALSRRWIRGAKVHGQPEADLHSADLPLRILCGSIPNHRFSPVHNSCELGSGR